MSRTNAALKTVAEPPATEPVWKQQIHADCGGELVIVAVKAERAGKFAIACRTCREVLEINTPYFGIVGAAIPKEWEDGV